MHVFQHLVLKAVYRLVRTRSLGNFGVISIQQLKEALISRFKVHYMQNTSHFPFFGNIMDFYKTHCDSCPANFNKTTVLLRHRKAKHVEAKSIKSLPFYSGNGIKLSLPSCHWKGRRPVNYNKWLGGVVDSINSRLHPKAPGT